MLALLVPADRFFELEPRHVPKLRAGCQ
jgi:hypothetical protein